jgi:hypothetical protein
MLEIGEESFFVEPALNELGISAAIQGEASGSEKSIYADSCATHPVLNKSYKHLFHSLKDCQPTAISGVGGRVTQKVTGYGDIVFMGKSIRAYYAPEISKSVISEGYLCRYSNFRITREGTMCTIMNKTDNSTLTIEADGTLYRIPESAFTTEQQQQEQQIEISLASVRPANPLVLLHQRLGHYNIETILKMSRTPIYQERGFRLPEKFTKSDREPDLCDTCARAKPTFSHTFTPQTRSKIRGKLWYFDISGGGNLIPSLIDGNIYVYCFADSFSRKYFEYFAKNKDNKTTLRILNQFNSEILSRVRLDIGNDDIIFIQSNNGELNTAGVTAFTRSGGIFQKFIHPYHPNMNGFIERAFRSMKDLGRCIMLHAGLPEPYWQKATSYALRLLDIMPN